MCLRMTAILLSFQTFQYFPRDNTYLEPLLLISINFNLSMDN